MKLRIPTCNHTFHVQHDKRSTITIMDEPLHASIEYMPGVRARGLEGTHAMDTLQSIEMMDFQANVAMLLRAEMKLNQLTLPLPRSRYSVEIDVDSMRSAADIPLIHVVKSVIDGLNKEILGNDVLIFEATIKYFQIKKPARSSSKPQDLLSVRIYDLSGTNIKNYIAGLCSVPIYIVAKASPLLLDAEVQQVWPLFDEMMQEEIATAILKDGMQIAGDSPRHIQMSFTTDSVASIDLDNMARPIYPIINKLGVMDGEVHSIHLIKQAPISGQSAKTKLTIQ